MIINLKKVIKDQREYNIREEKMLNEAFREIESVLNNKTQGISKSEHSIKEKLQGIKLRK